MARYVKDVMTPYNRLVILEPNQTVHDALVKMDERNIHCILINPARSGKYWRIFSETDLLMAVESGFDIKKIAVGEWSSQAIYTANPDWTCDKAGDYMIKHGVKHLPVIDDASRLIGIISSRDIIHSY